MGKIKTFASKLKSFVSGHKLAVAAGLVVLAALPAAGVAAAVLAGSASRDELDMAGVELGYNHE